MKHFLPPPRVSLVAVVAAVALALPAWAGAAPTPTNLRVTSATSTAISISWEGPAATFGVYRNGRYEANTKVAAYTFSGLGCGTSHNLGVRTFLGGGDSSTLAQITAQTTSCGTTPQPGPTSPTNTAPPTISGTLQSGSTVTAGPGTWTGSAPMSYAYRWSRCDSAGNACVTVGGAVSPSYLLSAADVGSRMRVVLTASNAAGSTSATSPATAVVGTTTTLPSPQPTPPPGDGGSVVVVDRAFVCNGPVNLDLVRVTIRNVTADAISLGANCSGRIGRVEVETWSSDGIKVQNNSATPAHDLVIGGGYVRCHAIAPGVHQDGLQAMGGHPHHAPEPHHRLSRALELLRRPRRARVLRPRPTSSVRAAPSGPTRPTPRGSARRSAPAFATAWVASATAIETG